MKAQSGKCFANIHVIATYDHSLAAYLEMADELRKTFPEADNESLECRTVANSGIIDNFALLAYNREIEKKCYTGWIDTDKKPSYNLKG